MFFGRSTRSIVFALLIVFAVSGFAVIATSPDVQHFVRGAPYYTNGYSDSYILNRVGQVLIKTPEPQQSLLYYYTPQEILQIARGTSDGVQLVNSMDSATQSAANGLIEGVLDPNGGCVETSTSSVALLSDGEVASDLTARNSKASSSSLSSSSSSLKCIVMWGKSPAPANTTTPPTPPAPAPTSPPGSSGACPSGGTPPTGTCTPGQTTCRDYAHCPQPSRTKPDVSRCFACVWTCGPSGTWTTGNLCVWPACFTTKACT